jgi:hypothetical protein
VNVETKSVESVMESAEKEVKKRRKEMVNSSSTASS